jgi:hypothetical protein
MAVLCVDKSGFAKIRARVTVVTAFPLTPALSLGEREYWLPLLVANSSLDW